MSTRITQDHVLIVLLLVVVLASFGDLLADARAGASWSHFVQEGVILLFAGSTLAWLLRELRRKQGELRELYSALETNKNLQTVLSTKLTEARQSLRVAISEQFSQWQLTQSEREVGLMLLKGYSLKEIALLRGTSEKTIRQQASAIYQKSNLSGRHALSAWFVEDML